MNKKKKDFMNQLNNLDDFSVEEIAEKYPALNKSTKKRILKKCMKKDSFFYETGRDGEGRITISGTERYNHKPWYKFAASAAAFVIAIGGITGVFMLGRNIREDDISKIERSPATSFSDKDADETSKNSAPSTNNTPISLNGTNWFKHEDNGPTEKEIEFNNDGTSGFYIIYPENVLTTESTKIPFTYVQNGYDITFCMSPDDTVTAKLSVDDRRVIMTIEWQDGHTESFYDYDIPITSSDDDNVSDGFGNLGTNENNTPQTTTEAKEPTANNTVSFDNVSLNETYWSEGEIDGPTENRIEFDNDGFSGHYVIPPEDYTTTDATLIYFTYTQNGNEILIYMGSDTATGKLSSSNNDLRGQVMMTLVWADGRTEYFYTYSITINSDGSLEYHLPYDGGYTAQPTTTDNNLVSLNETYWSEFELDSPTENRIEFGNDGFSGHYVIPPEDYTTTDATLIYFTYTQNGNEISFWIGSDTATGKLSSSNNDPRGQVMMTLVWANGLTEYLYNDDIPVTDLQN
jgi:hypothetical protein rflaF_05404